MDGKRLVQTFLDLVRIDSPSGYEEKVREYVSEFVKKLGLKPFQDKRGNLIVRVNGVGEPLLLGAHLDTVEPGRNVKPKIENGIIKSDGKTILGADNKVGVAAILEVLKFLVNNKIKTKPLDVVLTVEEEEEFGSIKLDYTKIRAKKGYIFDSLIPLGGIITASPFYNRFDIKIIGKAVHASLPHEAINALVIFNKAFSKIKIGKINNKTIANVGIVNGGHARNTIPGEITINGEVRSFVEEDVEKYSNLIVDAFRKSAEKMAGKTKSEIVRYNPGYEYEANDEFILKTKKIVEDFGLQPILVKKWACSDANIFNAHGIKVLNLGDGVNNPHTVRESVSTNDILKLSELIVSLMTNKQ